MTSLHSSVMMGARQPSMTNQNWFVGTVLITAYQQLSKYEIQIEISRAHLEPYFEAKLT